VPVRTLKIDALGSRGVRFEKAICPSPLCAPSRAPAMLGDASNAQFIYRSDQIQPRH
jgi:arylsulfatase A-like enzyme